MRREDEVRGGVWVIVVASLALCAGVLWLAFTLSHEPRDAAQVAERELAPSIDDGRWREVVPRPRREPPPGLAPAIPRSFRTPFGDAPVSLEDDPQLQRSRLSYEQLTDAGVPEFATLEAPGRVVSVSGTSPVAVGDRCSVRVLPVRASYNCMIRVFCGDVLLYPEPGQMAGYTHCDVGASGTPERAEDSFVTRIDTDPRVRVDMQAGEVVVSDEADDGRVYSATIELPSRVRSASL